MADVTTLPQISTPRLVLRAFDDTDAPRVRLLAGDRRVADTTLTIPHPYPEGAAEAWVVTHEASWELGRGMTLAITLRDGGQLVGAIALAIDPKARTGELGYWIGADAWRRGYCTEAARAVVAFAFAQLDLKQITAHHLVRNPASGRVLEKIGMTRDRLETSTVLKWGQAEAVQFWRMHRPADDHV